MTLIGYSGGGQIALGAATFVSQVLGRKVRLISLGGVFCSDPGLDSVEHMSHICGDRDGVQRLGERIFPRRWSSVPNSTWNRALQEGRITVVPMGDMQHSGSGGYLDEQSRLESGETYMEHTANIIAELIAQAVPPVAATADS